MTRFRESRIRILALISMLVGALVVTGILNVDDVRSASKWLIGVNPIEEFTAQSAAPETAIHVYLAESSRSHYGPTPPRRHDWVFQQAAERTGFNYDANLAHAAREVANFYRETRRLAPSGVLAFLLDSAGATFWGVRQTVIVTTDQGPDALSALLDPPDESGEWVVGIGELVVDDGQPLRIIVALSAQRTIELQPTPRSYSTGEKISLRGVVDSEYRDLFALAMGPAGVVKTLIINSEDDHFSGHFAAAPGEWVVEIIGTSRSGPVPLAQLTLHVDEPVPSYFGGVWPPREEAVPDLEQYMLSLINADRAQAELPPLARNGALDRVARGHSGDMMENAFVGHISPSTGTVGNRLDALGVRRLAHGENVALNSSVTDAHRGLMRSLGHRRNLLSRDFTHVGIGLARSRQGWYVTQVFSRPTGTAAIRTMLSPAALTVAYSASRDNRYGALAN